MASFSFNPADVAPRENNYDLIPAGSYAMQIVDTSVAPLSTGSGQGLKLTCEVLADGYRGRKIFQNLCVQHTKPKTEEIAQQQLRELCDAIGLARMTDTSQLHGKPFEGKVKIRVPKPGSQYGAQNEVVGFKSFAGTVAPAFRAPAANTAPASTATAAAPAAGGAKTPPWATKAAVPA